jgi:hypothetical protein
VAWIDLVIETFHITDAVRVNETNPAVKGERIVEARFVFDS